MIDKLHSASSLLKYTLEKYLDACSTISDCCFQPGNDPKGAPRAVLDCIVDELHLVTSYATRLNHAKVIISRVRNSYAITPINRLPSEIMTHIFRLVLDTESCYFEHHDPKKDPPLLHQPDVLTHVCSRWRQIALDSPDLWSHIDLAPYRSSNQIKSSLSRAYSFTTRASQSPLKLHIIGKRTEDNRNTANDPSSVFYNNLQLAKFCGSVAGRVQSLEFSQKVLWDVYIASLQSFFANSVPGSLNRLVFGTHSTYGFILSNDNNIPSITMGHAQIDVSGQCLETALRPVRILRLNGLYFDWTSQAYHGLLELRLTSENIGTRLHISQFQLRGILAASPGLRVFHFNIEISLPEDAPTSQPPIKLDALEVFIMDIRHSDNRYFGQCEALVGMIAPGLNPLRMTIRFRQELQSLALLLRDQFEAFFTRSKITELDIACYWHRPHLRLPKLLGLLPNLQNLSLDHINFFCLEPYKPLFGFFDYGAYQPAADETLSPADHNESPAPECRLETFSLHDCRFSLNELQLLAGMVPIRRLQLRGCRIKLPDREQYSVTYTNEGDWLDGLGKFLHKQYFGDDEEMEETGDESQRSSG